MATGVSRTKWNGDLQANTCNNGQCSYHPVWQNGNSANRLYYGDNLTVMNELRKDETVRGKIRLVYIDPPYATNSIFQTRKQQNAYTDLLTGDAYIDFMRERLTLMKELLSEAGSIYIHLDNKMVFRLTVFKTVRRRLINISITR
ncbi:MAG: site-specific DNA-methyltransferase [Prevotella sp.]|jgi:adenine-specific DNA-methyltransferase|nr:site-specific DNA-methyltransferase [Prevotella sp.]